MQHRVQKPNSPKKSPAKGTNGCTEIIPISRVTVVGPSKLALSIFICNNYNNNKLITTYIIIYIITCITVTVFETIARDIQKYSNQSLYILLSLAYTISLD